MGMIRYISKEEIVKELIEVWKAGNTEKVLAIIKKHPELTKTLDLIEKKKKIPLYLKYSDLFLSLSISIPLSFLFVHLTRGNILPANDDNLSLILQGVLLIGISTLTSSLISLKPFGYRSLRLPIWISILTMEIAQFTYMTWDSYDTYLVSNATIPFHEYYINNTVGLILSYAVALLMFGTVLVGLVSMHLTRFLIGIPKVDEPYKISFDVSTNLEEFKKNLDRTLNSHFLFGELTKHNHSWFGKFTTKKKFQESMEYVAAVEMRELEKNLSVRMLFYRKGGVIIPKIVRDDFSKMLGYDVAKSLTTKFEEVPSSKMNDFEGLYNFTLGYTRSWLQELIDRNWSRLGRKAYIVIGIVATTLLIIYYWNGIIKHLTPIKETILVLSAIATILGWLGLTRYKKKV